MFLVTNNFTATIYNRLYKYVKKKFSCKLHTYTKLQQ